MQQDIRYHGRLRDGEVGNLIIRGCLANSVDLAGSESCGELGVSGQNLDVNGRAGRAEDDRKLHSARSWAYKVIRISTGPVGVECGLQICGSWEEGFSDIKSITSRSAVFLSSVLAYSLATSALPAAAVSRAVLCSTWDLRVEHPDCRHVSQIPSSLGIRGHRELKEENLISSANSVCNIH